MPATVIKQWGTSSNAAAKVQIIWEIPKFFKKKL